VKKSVGLGPGNSLATTSLTSAAGVVAVALTSSLVAVVVTLPLVTLEFGAGFAGLLVHPSVKELEKQNKLKSGFS
jgi:hypothetical protein